MPVTEVKKTWSTTSFGCGEKRLWDADTERLRGCRHPHRALAAPASAPRITFCLKLGDGARVCHVRASKRDRTRHWRRSWHLAALRHPNPCHQSPDRLSRTDTACSSGARAHMPLPPPPPPPPPCLTLSRKRLR